MRNLPLSPLIRFKRSLILLFCCTVFLLYSAPLASADTTVGGTINTDTTWSLSGSPYIVTSNIIVQGSDGADGVTTLTIEPDVEVRFNTYTQISVGASYGNPGALRAQGTAADPIIFTSNQTTPTSGHWRGIYFYNTADDANTVMEHCTVQYAGFGNAGQIYINQGSGSLSQNLVLDFPS